MLIMQEKKLAFSLTPLHASVQRPFSFLLGIKPEAETRQTQHASYKAIECSYHDGCSVVIRMTNHSTSLSVGALMEEVTEA